MHSVNCGPRVRGQVSRGLGEPVELFAGTEFSMIINSYQCSPENKTWLHGGDRDWGFPLRSTPID